jgi:hypothetical protein
MAMNRRPDKLADSARFAKASISPQAAWLMGASSLRKKFI